ncbi:MAG: pyridoxamine 5'-phosphate oxidase family protein [Rhodospirillaceae bacterium]|nr:pyridoxamine 5'-phosphate oxidase family protein [Rhodospirillaceae bacterium]
MGKVLTHIDDTIRAWVARQRMFFVSTAPLSGEGMVNCSPKGGDYLRIVDDKTVVYLDFAGSGVETIAHLREPGNGRIVIMLCAFEGPPKIVRFHGIGDVVLPDDPDFAELSKLFADDLLGVRSIIRLKVERVSDSCGFGVPVYDFKKDRDGMRKWSEKKGADGVRDYVASKNAVSIDGIPGVSVEEAKTVSPTS